ncbi:hypothetical protein C8F04DRAFT_1322464 [Mycena alexandri]|uniref:Uncharacterized protein n=1 Tax=Mycena alexandri TaxID=1745969 RepID=A0AAD6TGY0_9AGAR|nr:hypothetical protein C8F04DRAFT_1322464 [Mycena alexandri]
MYTGIKYKALPQAGIEQIKVNDHGIPFLPRPRRMAEICFHADTSVSSELSGSTANVGSDTISATTFAEDKTMVNATSAEVAETALGSVVLTPGAFYQIRNKHGRYLTRWGPDGVIFEKTYPDVYCNFQAARFPGTNYVTLRTDAGTTINVDRGFNPPALWLYPLYAAGAFEAISAGEGKYYLIVRDMSRLDQGPWVVKGENINGNAITTAQYPATIHTVYITEVHSLEAGDDV